ncbi:hypothetical protein [Streptomyces sp. NPDC005799]|uniref:hypothetical protein n=1 Tax=Streptomyces sp. NPDC005799 TaxID=3154678 RepID=UPI0033E21BC6
MPVNALNRGVRRQGPDQILQTANTGTTVAEDAARTLATLRQVMPPACAQTREIQVDKAGKRDPRLQHPAYGAGHRHRGRRLQAPPSRGRTLARRAGAETDRGHRRTP